MPSETHKRLYQNLADIADRVKSALDKNDATALMGITAEHKNTMDKLRRSGVGRDPGLLEQIQKTRDRINLAIAEIHRQRDELSRQLGQSEKKKTVSAAYAKNVINK